jgi:hypothetical protein
MFQEIMMANTEKQLAQARLDVEHQKGLNEQTGILLEGLKKDVEAKENDLSILESDLRHSMHEVQKKQGAVDSLQRKLEKLTSNAGVGVRQRNRAYSVRPYKHIYLIDIYLSFHEILAWQVPVDVELDNMNTQKISLLHNSKKTMQRQINSQNNMLVIIEINFN